MRGPAAALGAASLAVLAAGCIGSAATTGTTTPTAGGAHTQTRVVVRFPVGRPARRRAELRARCPRGARCRVVHVRPSQVWTLVAARTLTCDPDGGGYQDPRAACAALRHLARIELHPGGSACACPVELVPGPRLAGHLGRHRIVFDLGPCAACSLGRHAAADMNVLVPA
jgi:hypothetical protein